jgi:putative nucleotidyltransferase with HDIG domain
MSTLRLPFRAAESSSEDGSGIVRRVFLYLGAATVLSAVLLAHTFPNFRGHQVVAVLSSCLVGLALVRFHLRHTDGAAVAPRTAERILLFTTLLAIAGLQLGTHALATQGSTQYGVAFLAIAPIVAAAMLVSGLLGPTPAIFAVTLNVLGAGIAQIADPRMLAGAWLVGAAAAHAVNPLRQRNDLFRATYVTTAAYSVMAVSIALLDNAGAQRLLLSAGWGAVSGVGASALFWLAIAGFERGFGITSDWTLLELVSPEQKLLRELMMRAPGTYAHSVMVGNLGEAAASSIGANALLCRAMAYYHDVGKMRRPEFFIENQRSENPHERLTPTLSARIISAHVRDGLEMAAEAKLPRAIRDGIEQHHGTSLISYFYHMASGGAEKDPVLEQQFRYSGPLPRTKEAAILMVADRVEAATRSVSRLSPGRLRAFIWEIVRSVRDDGQLDDSELNFRDLHTVVGSFVATIGAMNHDRVEYPGVSTDVLVEDPSDFGALRVEDRAADAHNTESA